MQQMARGDEGKKEGEVPLPLLLKSSPEGEKRGAF
jgi:hypothetical protein